MIKFSADNPKIKGRKLIGLGLSHKNLEKLKEGQPIHIHAEELGITGFALFDLFIFAGETEASMQKEIQAFITPETKISTGRETI